MKPYRLLVLSLLCISIGSFVAGLIQTDNGNIEIKDVRFKGEAGQTMSGLLYLPASATAETPQAAVLAVHGYINSRETQSGFAIEFARRGFVVLALDQTGHGYSDAPAFAHGFGGPDGLRYLRSLPQVDKSRIGLEGHSMGGWTVLMAAAAMPDAYSAMVLSGSSTGTFGTPEGTENFPKNLLLIFSKYDEFSEFMWGAPIPADIVATDKLKMLFGVSEGNVKIGQRYGDVKQGSARQLSMPSVTHPGDHLSTEVIGQSADWLQEALKPSRPLPNTDQTWLLKELATLVAFIGLVLFLIAAAQHLLGGAWFKALNKKTAGELSQPIGQTGSSWKLSAVLTALVPIVTFFPVQTIGGVLLPPNAVFSQAMTNGITLWMLVNGGISLLAFFIWAKKSGSEAVARTRLSLGEFLMSGLFACLVCGLAYLLLVSADTLFAVDFRFWVVALKLMSSTQWIEYFVYLPIFCVFFISLDMVLHIQLRSENHSLSKALANNTLLLSSGFVLLLLLQYLPLFLGSTLLISSQPLLTIVAIQFVPLMIIIGLISTVCFRASNSIYPGAWLNGLFVCWYVVAGQATQVVPFL